MAMVQKTSSGYFSLYNRSGCNTIIVLLTIIIIKKKVGRMKTLFHIYEKLIWYIEDKYQVVSIKR